MCVPADLIEIARLIEGTLTDVGFDLRFLDGYMNKPGDADYWFVGTRIESDRVIVQCVGCHITIEAATEVSVRGNTVRILQAAKVEFVNEDSDYIASVTTSGDEIVGHWTNIWGLQTPHVPKLSDAPIAELVGVYRRCIDSATGETTYTDL
jgi:hypothetical protein